MLPDHAEPLHLLLVEFLPGASMARHDPLLEIAAHGFRIGRKGRVNAARAADQSHQRRQLSGRLPSFVFVE